MNACTYWFNRWMDEQDKQWALPMGKRNWTKCDVYFKRYMMLVGWK